MGSHGRMPASQVQNSEFKAQYGQEKKLSAISMYIYITFYCIYITFIYTYITFSLVWGSTGV
jgi:hypothetical protein